ncbi:MerR family DNA-binding transcriptional regulator [Paludibacterium denitrificans]|uniref:MerR family DNA-binding transcriptional regulator n=1 Tax=Paludibacterium denitrificans TaxID=2675226 RepID=UPI001E54957E|nr:MerR family DNA-binding transcriptional regulator [Paludibacterium denitrificans]
MKAEPSFTISDLAREFDVTTRTIRFYEDQGLLELSQTGAAAYLQPHVTVSA